MANMTPIGSVNYRLTVAQLGKAAAAQLIVNCAARNCVSVDLVCKRLGWPLRAVVKSLDNPLPEPLPGDGRIIATHLPGFAIAGAAQ